MSTMVQRIAARRLATEFSSQEALEKHLKEHPNAKREDHTVAKPKLSLQKKKLDEALTQAQDILMTQGSRDKELAQLSRAVIKEEKSTATKLLDSVKDSFSRIGEDAQKSCSAVGKLLSGDAKNISAAEVKGAAKTTVMVLGAVLAAGVAAPAGAAAALGAGLCTVGQSLAVKTSLNAIRCLFTGSKAVDVGVELAEIADDINDAKDIVENSIKISKAVSPLLANADLLKDTGDFLTSVFAAEDKKEKEPNEKEKLKTQVILAGIALAALQTIAKKGLKQEEIEELIKDQKKLNFKKEATERVASRYLSRSGLL